MEMVDEYNSIQSDVKINAVFQGLYEEMEIKMLTAAVTRQLPDVAQEKFEYLNLYIDEGLLKPIDSELSASDRSESISIPTTWKEELLPPIEYLDTSHRDLRMISVFHLLHSFSRAHLAVSMPEIY